ncbi:restriction endonuclease subunit S [Streptomyces sp. P10-4]|uniref:restriction endonuclease subunit S n=1 Tax=Streptomyces sp. P10-4 TaxID=3421645 RepID=UPI003D2DF287
MTDSGTVIPAGAVPGDALPQGWARATLGELGVEVQPGFASGKHNRDGKGVVHLRPMNITRNGSIDTSEARFVVDDTDRRVEYGDVLFNNTNSPTLVGKTAWVDVVDPLAYSNHMTRLRPPKGLDSKFLARQLHHLWALGYFQAVLNNHVNQASVSRKTLLETPIVVPPLAEQHRIIAKLDEQLAHIVSAEAALAVVDRKEGDLLRAALRDALRGALVDEDLTEGGVDALVPDSVALFQGPWDIPRGWRWTTIGSLFRVFVGSTPSRSNPTYWGGGVPWVSSGEVAFGRIASTRESIALESIANPETRIHPPGTVMVAMIGEGKTRGQAAILDISAAHNQNCASVRVSETKILPEYVYYFFVARYEDTRREASGGNQPALNKGKIQALRIPIPPLGTQRRIVARVQEFERDLLDLRETLRASRVHGSHLRTALLQAAFTGTLVPQDPADEPASKLLVRIHAQRECAATAKKGTVCKRTTPRLPRPRKQTASGQEELPL